MDETAFKRTTLALPVTSMDVLLGVKIDPEKETSIGQGKLNGYGGHIETGESSEQAMIRELLQEVGILAKKYEKVAEMTYIFPNKPRHNQIVDVYLVYEWDGEPHDTIEMAGHEFFPKKNLPLDRMWHNDQYWMPPVLEGRKLRGRVVHDGITTLEKVIEFIDSF